MKKIALLAFVFLFGSAFSRADVVNLSPCGCGNDAPAIAQAITQATQNGSLPGTVNLSGTFELTSSVSISLPNVTLQGDTSGAEVNAEGLTAFLLLPGSDGFVFSRITLRAARGIALNDLVNA